MKSGKDRRFLNPGSAGVIAALVSDNLAYMTDTCPDIGGGALLPIVTETDLDTDWSLSDN